MRIMSISNSDLKTKARCQAGEEGAEEGYFTPEEVPEVGTEKSALKKLKKALPKVRPGKYKTSPDVPSVPLKPLKTRENWARGNKDELLFERLIKKWVK